MTDTLAAALAELQAALPTVPKNKTAKVKGQTKDGRLFDYEYAYADLADVSSAVMPLMGKLGLSFTAMPTIRDDGKFGLVYKLLHSSGDELAGFYPIDDRMTPQQIGGLITYARRYVLGALTGIVAEEDTDAKGAEHAAQRKPRGKPPERARDNLPRNQDGSISRSQVTDDELRAAGVMDSEQQKEHTRLRDVKTGKTAERRTEADPDDAFYDPPPVARAARPPGRIAGIIVQHFERLGITDREERLEWTRKLADRETPIDTTNDLNAAEGAKVLSRLSKCRDLGALQAAIKEPADA